MEYRYDPREISVDSKVVVNMIRDAHQYFIQHRIDENYQMMALDLIRRYISQEGPPRDPDPLFGAALYMVTRHPWSHPNPLTKTEFAMKLRMKESSLEWYTDSIADKLGFVVLHDKNQLPFFVDSQGTIASVISSVVRASVGEEIVRSVTSNSMVASFTLAQKIVDRLCNIVNIVPLAFEQELQTLVQRMIEEESERLLNQLRGK
ncbi:MAG: hypothetical protein ACFFED_07030 [Candidatus Thorarchaeota archaeon]